MHWPCLGKPDWNQHPELIDDAATRKPIALRRMARWGIAQVKQCFQFALDNLKPTDAMIVGMYTQFGDQVAENAPSCANSAR